MTIEIPLGPPLPNGDRETLTLVSVRTPGPFTDVPSKCEHCRLSALVCHTDSQWSRTVFPDLKARYAHETVYMCLDVARNEVWKEVTDAAN